MGSVARAARTLGVAACLAAPAWWLPAGAQEPVPPAPAGPQEPAPAAAPGPVPSVASEPAPSRRGAVGLMLQLGAFAGTGGGVQVGTPAFGLRLSGGWAPVLLALTRPNRDPELKFYSTFVAAPDLYFRLAGEGSAAHVGAELGYRYSTLLGSGAAVGAYAQFSIGTVDALVNGGLLFFPSGETRIKDKENLQGVRFSFPGANVNLGISIALLFFP